MLQSWHDPRREVLAVSGLKLPDCAESGFHLVQTDAFGCRFSMFVYGRGRGGWFVASRRDIVSADSGWRELSRGQWPEFRHIVDVSGFWAMPEVFPAPENGEVDDGDWLTLLGRDVTREHRIDRFVWRERGLDTIATHLRRLSGLFPVVSALSPDDNRLRPT